MSWSELERFVDDAESDRGLQRSLKHCRSIKELILAARRLGYRITRIDLQRAWQEEQREQQKAEAGGEVWRPWPIKVPDEVLST